MEYRICANAKVSVALSNMGHVIRGMNKPPTETRIQILGMMVEGMSLRTAPFEYRTAGRPALGLLGLPARRGTSSTIPTIPRRRLPIC